MRRVAGLAVVMVALAACQGTPELGAGGSMAQGSAGPQGVNRGPQLVQCDTPIGTAALVEPSQEVLVQLQQVANLPSPTAALRLLMAQSRCFRVVDRAAALRAIEEEERLRRAGLLAPGRSARGRLLRTDYIITPNILFSNPNAGGFSGGAVIGAILGGPLGAAVGGAFDIRIQEAQVLLAMTDATTGEQVAVAEGSARVQDYGGAGGLGFVGSGIAGLGGLAGYGNTAEGKLLIAAFIDAHNKLVEQVRALRGITPPTQREVEAYDREMVREIQEELKARGYYRGAIDGLYGRGTREAIEQFQRDEGLSVTGQPSRDLLLYLRRTSTRPGAGGTTGM